MTVSDSLNDSLVTYNKDKIIVSDLLAEADKGTNSRFVVDYNENTLNTPYSDGLTSNYRSGTALITMSDLNHGQITVFVSGTSQIFIRSKDIGGGWTDWTEVVTMANKEDGFDMTKMFTMYTISVKGIKVPGNGSIYGQKADTPVVNGYKPYMISWFRLIGVGYAECSLSELYVDAPNNQIVYGIRNNGTAEVTLELITRVFYINTSVLNV